MNDRYNYRARRELTRRQEWSVMAVVGAVALAVVGVGAWLVQGDSASSPESTSSSPPPSPAPTQSVSVQAVAVVDAIRRPVEHFTSTAADFQTAMSEWLHAQRHDADMFGICDEFLSAARSLYRSIGTSGLDTVHIRSARLSVASYNAAALGVCRQFHDPNYVFEDFKKDSDTGVALWSTIADLYVNAGRGAPDPPNLVPTS